MRVRMAASLVSLLVLCTCLSAVDDLRTWSDVSGKYQIEAKFIAIEGPKVVLEKADGTRIQIELNKLKPQDRTEAMKLSMKKDDNPFKEKEESPFKDTPRNNGRMNSRKGKESSASQNAETIDWTNAKQLSVFGSEWKDPSIPASDLKLSWQPRPVALPSKDFFDKTKGIVACAAKKQAIVITSVERPGDKGDPTSTIYLCDLEKGSVIKAFPASGNQTPLAMSADGTQLVTREDVWGHNNNNVLTLWKISPTELKEEHRWNATQDDKNHGRDVQGAAWVNGNTLLTWQSNGLLTWWNTAELKPTQTLQLQGNSTPALSPDQKVLAAKSNNDLVLLDAVTGDTLSVKPIGPGNHQRFAFSPDGKKLACITTNKGEIYDLATANLVTAISATGFGPETNCFWASPTALLAGHPLCFLYPEMNVNVWRYDGIDKLAVLGDTTLIATKGQGFNIVPLKLPHSSALQMIEKAKSDPKFFVLKPGTKVRIDASSISDPALQEEVTELLSRKLQEAGHSAGSSNVTLVASMEKSKDHEVAYHTFPGPSFGRASKTHTVPGWSYQLKLVADGKTHWVLNGGNHPPPMIHLKENETIESHLKQYGVASANFFKHLEMPKYVARAQSDQTAGSQSLRQSQITPNGIR